MEKSTSPASSKKEKAVHQVEYVNLQEFGYEKSGNVKGDPDVYTSYLNMLLNGDLVDEKFSGLNEDEKPEKRSKLRVKADRVQFLSSPKRAEVGDAPESGGDKDPPF